MRNTIYSDNSSIDESAYDIRKSSTKYYIAT